MEALPVETSFTEELTYSVESKGSEFGMVYLNWERYKIGFEIKTNHLNFVRNALDKSYETANTQLKWVTYVEGADYLLAQNGSIDLGLEWIKNAEKELADMKEEWSANYMPKEYIMGHMYWLKAQLLAKKEDYKSAMKSIDKMNALEGNYLFYQSQKDALNMDDQIAQWQVKSN